MCRAFRGFDRQGTTVIAPNNGEIEVGCLYVQESRPTTGKVSEGELSFRVAHSVQRVTLLEQAKLPNKACPPDAVWDRRTAEELASFWLPGQFGLELPSMPPLSGWRRGLHFAKDRWVIRLPNPLRLTPSSAEMDI